LIGVEVLPAAAAFASDDQAPQQCRVAGRDRVVASAQSVEIGRWDRSPRAASF